VISCDTVIKFIRSVPYQFLNILASSAIHATKPGLTASFIIIYSLGLMFLDSGLLKYLALIQRV
jgi:hypothetical protein